MMIFQFILLQIIVFSAVIFFMKKILSNNTQVAVGRLNSTYQELLEKQKDLNEKIEEAEKEYQAKKDEAAQLADKYKQEAAEELRKKRDEVVKTAKAQADEMLERAKASSQEIYEKIEREVRAKGVNEAAELLRQAMAKRTLEGFHKLLLEDFLEQAKDFDLSKVGPQIETVIVKTPFPLTDEQKSKINSLISGKINRNLKIEEIQDLERLAGVSLQFGSLIVDGSLANSISDVAHEAQEKIQLGE